MTDVGGGSVSNTSRHNLARIPLRWMIRQCFLTDTGIRFHSQLLKTIGLNPDSLCNPTYKRPPPLFAEPGSPLLRIEEHEQEREAAGPGVGHERTSSSATLVDGDDGQKVLSEEEEDVIDALCPIYDELKLAPAWWTLEIIPLAHRVRDKAKGWVEKWMCVFLLCSSKGAFRADGGVRSVNMGRGRVVPEDAEFRVHRSVEIRMRAGKDGLLQGGEYTPNASFKSSQQMVFVD